MFTKLLMGLTVTGLLASAVPAASARAPRPRVQVHLDLGNVSVVVGRPAPVHQRVIHVDRRLLDKGIRLEHQGQRLIDEGRALQWRGRHHHKRKLVRRGERLEAQGYHLVSEGRTMQAAAHNRAVAHYY
jgi:hypothetical protein